MIDDTYDLDSIKEKVFEDVLYMTMEDCRDFIVKNLERAEISEWLSNIFKKTAEEGGDISAYITYVEEMDLQEKVHEIMMNNLPEPDIDSYEEQQIINQEEESEGVHPNE